MFTDYYGEQSCAAGRSSFCRGIGCQSKVTIVGAGSTGVRPGGLRITVIPKTDADLRPVTKL